MFKPLVFAMVLAISAPSFGQRPAPCVRLIREAGGNPPPAVSNASISIEFLNIRYQ